MTNKLTEHDLKILHNIAEGLYSAGGFDGGWMITETRPDNKWTGPASYLASRDFNELSSAVDAAWFKIGDEGGDHKNTNRIRLTEAGITALFFSREKYELWLDEQQKRRAVEKRASIAQKAADDAAQEAHRAARQVEILEHRIARMIERRKTVGEKVDAATKVRRPKQERPAPAPRRSATILPLRSSSGATIGDRKKDKGNDD
jgi:hypothetical protein